MENFQRLDALYKAIKNDNRISTTHISLYMSFFLRWSLNHFHNPISISRGEMMQIAKIGGKATYHKCIKDLHDYGYISYFPSFHPALGSLVYLNFIDPLSC